VPVKKKAAKGHARKHAGTAKHAKHHAKHHPDAHQLHVAHMQHLGLVTAKAKPATHAKARALALDGTGCCASEALAASLRLHGVPVGLDDVLGLHRAAGADDDHGAPIRVLLEAAAEYGLAGYRPVFTERAPQVVIGGQPQRHGDLEIRQRRDALHGLGGELGVEVVGVDVAADLDLVHALILGMDLPGPHAVLATADGWWSWGELHCPCEWPDAVIEEAWTVTWQVTP
jgi:hypothetical protein